MLEKILAKLHGVVKNRSGYMAICPSHEDKEPSLSVSAGMDGITLLYCHGGCDIESILTALGMRMKDLYDNVETEPKNKIAATYDYRDEAGRVLFQTVRMESKKFYQRRPNGKGWINDLQGVRRVPYRLPELLQADKAFPVFIVEGEKDVENLLTIGITATCNPMGAGKWRDEFSDHLKGFQCVVLPDHDASGNQHAEAVAKSLLRTAAEVSILRLPDLPDKGDVSDWIAKGNTAADLYALLSGAENIQPDEPRTARANGSFKTEKRSSETQASKLMKLAQDAELFHTPDSEAFATVSVNSHKENYPVKSRAFRYWLSLQHWNKEGSTPSSQAMQDVVHGLSGQAIFEGKAEDVHLRVAEFEGSLYLDLGNDHWDAVQMTPDGWSVISEPPVKFRRTRGTLPLPKPEKGGNIAELKRFANVSEHDWPLALAWLAANFRPNKPFPVLVLHGEQGSGKSTTAKVLRLLIDPNKSPLRSSPKDERDLMIAANNSWVISLDNLSSMSVALSDSLCRLSTGGGFATRELFSDGEEVLLSLMRPVILNGIDEVINRSDLLDRAILLHLPRLATRFDETTFWVAFEAARPRILGSLLDAVCIALSRIDNTTVAARTGSIDLPRLADFTLWGVAAETGLGLPEGQFLEHYKGNREGVHDLALDCDPFAEKVLEFMKYRPAWTGLPSELFDEILKITANNISGSRGFPKNAQSIGKRLSLLAPNLREHGTEYVAPDRSRRQRTLTLRRIQIDSEPD
ncbi:MAG: hypothetical protein AB7F88_07215 [Pyrinomonadaceae bacterium]